MAGKDRDLSCDLPRLAGVRATTLAGVFSLAVLANDHPVKVIRTALAQRGLSTAEHTSWAYIGILLERLANG
jgi:hypothetical protein